MPASEPQGSLTGLALADDTIRHFGTDGGLRVLPVSAVMRPESARPTETARRLGAAFVLTTQVTPDADGIVVRSRLVRQKDGSAVWSETRHGKASELLALEDDLTVSLRRELLGKGAPEPPPFRHITSNLGAYAAYMRGLTFLAQRTSEGTYKAIDALEQATADDPAFAQAEAALAEAYSFDLGKWEKAEPTARLALSLNPQMGEGHAVLGLIAMLWHNDFAEAGDQLRMALQLNPNDPLTHLWYGNLFAAQGRMVEANEEVRLARNLDPYSDAVNLGAARIFYLSRKFDQARDLCLQVLSQNPEFLQAHILLHEVYVQQREYDKAMDEFRATEKLAGGSGLYNVTQINALEQAYRRDGIEGFWNARASYLEAGSYHDDYELAKYLAMLGRKNEALERIRRAMETPGSPRHTTMFARDEPAFDGLAADPRFVQITAGR
jgi:Tfp pilus assembly protein PilF/TolB-like protein